MNLRGTPLSKIHGSTPPPPRVREAKLMTTYSPLHSTDSLGRLSNNDGDGNKNGKKAMGSIGKTTTLHVYHAFFVHFFAVTTGPQYDEKLPNFYGIRAMNFETAR